MSGGAETIDSFLAANCLTSVGQGVLKAEPPRIPSRRTFETHLR